LSRFGFLSLGGPIDLGRFLLRVGLAGSYVVGFVARSNMPDYMAGSEDET
jgi:hypothetical protein